MEGEGGLKQRERRQLIHVGPLQQPAEAVGGLLDVAAVEFGDAHDGEGVGPGVGEEVTAHHLIEQQRVGAGLAQRRQGHAADLDAVGRQPLFRQPSEQAFRLGAGAGTEDDDLALSILALGFKERILGFVEDALEELDGIVPVLGGDVFVGRLDLVGGLAVGGQHHRVGAGAEQWVGRPGRRGYLADADGRRQGQQGQDGEGGHDDARSGQTCHRVASSGSDRSIGRDGCSCGV